eukprot:g27501.t1
MVVKTDTCYYTENRIYPGHGTRFVHKNGKLLHFLNQKARSLYFQKIKALRLTWTQAWRRKNKKGRVDAVRKKRKKAVGTKFKSIQGLSMADIEKKRTLGEDVRKANREARIRALKTAKKKTKDENKKKFKAAGGPAKKKDVVKQPKTRRAMNTSR